jgi:hypothetical protein
MLGMTAQQVEDETNWASPDRRNRTITASGTVEQWVYEPTHRVVDGGYLSAWLNQDQADN